MRRDRKGSDPPLAAIERKKRLFRIEELTLQAFPVAQIAVRLGLTTEEVRDDYAVLRQIWRDRERDVEAQRDLTLRKLEFAQSLAMSSFEVSKSNAEETTTTQQPRRCKACQGSGQLKDKKCSACKGEGSVLAEVVTHRVRGQAGDSSFLKLYVDCEREAARLRGLVEPRRGMAEVMASKERQELHAHLQSIDPRLVPPHLLHKLRLDLEEIQEAVLEAQKVAPTVLEVDAKPNNE